MKPTILKKTMAKEKLILSSSLIASVLASLCCIAPVVALGLGLGSFGLGSFFETLRPYLLAITSLLLGIAFYLTYRKSAVCENGVCKNKNVLYFNKLMLWIVTGFVIIFAAFPYYSSVFVPKSSNPQTTIAKNANQIIITNISQTTIKIEGMTCAGCAANVESALKQQPGVKSVSVTLEPGQAIVSFDSNQVIVAQLIEAINKLGYKASI